MSTSKSTSTRVSRTPSNIWPRPMLGITSRSTYMCKRLVALNTFIPAWARPYFDSAYDTVSYYGQGRAHYHLNCESWCLANNHCRAKHSYMLHTNLCRVMMLSQQPLASSSSTWYIIPTNISTLTLLVCIKVVNQSYGLHNQLNLLSRISTPKL